MEIAMATWILSPKCHPAWLWNNALKVVTNHLSKQNTSVANKSWYLYHRFCLSSLAHTQCWKYTLEVVFLSESVSHRPLKKINFETTCRLILNDYDQISPKITKVATISLFMHVTRVPAGQCFSLQNWVCVEWSWHCHNYSVCVCVCDSFFCYHYLYLCIYFYI